MDSIAQQSQTYLMMPSLFHLDSFPIHYTTIVTFVHCETFVKNKRKSAKADFLFICYHQTTVINAQIVRNATNTPP